MDIIIAAECKASEYATAHNTLFPYHTGFQSIAAVAVSTSEIKVSWVLGGLCTEAAASISIVYTDLCQIVTHVDPSASEYRMTGLRPSTTYIFNVSASNDLGAVHELVQAVTSEQPCVCTNTGMNVQCTFLA